ncbi:sensor histidine kinase [Natrialbaceae archaeon A-CW1-1]
MNHTENAINRVEYTAELEQFVSVVSHDLRNPLQVASGYLELAQEVCESSHLDQIEEMHTRMDALIEELLVLAQQGDILSGCVLIDLVESINDSWHSVATAEATLNCDVDTGTRINTDPFRLQQLLANLFRNAIEHAGSDVTVCVGLLDEGFYVEDDGPWNSR